VRPGSHASRAERQRGGTGLRLCNKLGQAPDACHKRWRRSAPCARMILNVNRPAPAFGQHSRERTCHKVRAATSAKRLD